MVLGDGVAIWQFSILHSQFERLTEEDQKQLAVLRVHTDLLAFRDQLESLVATENADRFAAGAAPLRDVFLRDTDRAGQAVREAGPSKLSVMLEAVRSAFPTQIRAMTDLAATGDWNAVRLRLKNQVSALRAVTAAAADEVDGEVAGQRAQAILSIQRLQRRLLLILPMTALLTLLTAGMLGFVVTRTITGPLARLDAGARALARGELSHQVEVTGQDELAALGRAFNHAAQQLQRSYNLLATGLNERIQAEKEILALNERLINAQEEERMRIARELHDDLSQQIAALSISVSTLKQHLPGQKLEAREQAERLQHRLVQLAESVRHLSHRLHPAVLEHAGLAAALRSYCAEFSILSGVNVSCDAEPTDDLPPAVALCIYRVTQEALQNVAKHALAKEAEVRLRCSNGLVCLTVSDHGAGCSLDRARVSGGLGLVSMHERVRLVNGTFEFKSEPKGGTMVKVEIPVNVSK
jgi:signal transduction histidine kinase